ncbi:hypothetical protein O6H91_11G068600 [Diphasiastrum complanatum]|uniref:Uncharacterized protein n=1 Tax=Diphasiastrum complanatum TaxID=34168 RepID=A0ACC2CAL4_DIPCM|nr:hypothetical protein O6H91_11G068600 [Diphasiastrum complanatum]
MSSRKISESAEGELNEIVAKEPISNCFTMASSMNMTNSSSKNQGAAMNLEEESQCVKVSSISSENSPDTYPCPQKLAGSLPKVKAEPADESSIPSQWCLKEGNGLMSTALPEITVFLDIDPGLCANKYETKMTKTEDEAEPCENLEDVPLSKRRKLLQSNTFHNKKKAGSEQLCIPGKIGAVSRHGAIKKRFTTPLPSAVADYVRGEEKRKNVSMESALQEDAPGLLEALRENGLYEDVQAIGTVWEDDSEESRHQNEDFEELEGVMSKLWGPCSGLFKEGRARLQLANSGNKPSYCMPCLVSLIEQTRAFRQRKWPVEWGWCRQLCAFLFVFENHNRIVLERPEYGYATYFFELVQELPVRWQVQRVVKVMSVTNNCRAALVENRALEVGMDLVEEEAAILEDYGWIPNSGIGSLLNFCDRVSHDYKSDEMIDWRSKIGKLLMDGHDHGRIISRIPRKFQGKNVDIVDNSSNLAFDDKVIGGADTTVSNDGIYAVIKEEQ